MLDNIISFILAATLITITALILTEKIKINPDINKNNTTATNSPINALTTIPPSITNSPINAPINTGSMSRTASNTNSSSAVTTTKPPTTLPPTTPPPTTPTVLGIASQYKVEGEGSKNDLFYTSYCSGVPNHICYGEYRLRFSNGVISPMTIRTEAPSGLTNPSLRFKLSNIPTDGVRAFLQVKNVATNSNDNNWYDANVPSQFIKPSQTEVTFINNTSQPRKINKKENINCVYARIPNNRSITDGHKYLGEFDSYEECVENAEIPSNAKAITWHKNIPNWPWSKTCFSINDNNTNTVDNSTTCGVLS